MNISSLSSKTVIRLVVTIICQILFISCSKREKFNVPETHFSQSNFREIRQGVDVPNDIEWQMLKESYSCDKDSLVEQGVISSNLSYIERIDNEYIMYSDYRLDGKLEIILIDTNLCRQYQKVLDYKAAFRIHGYDSPGISIDDISPDMRYVIVRSFTYPYIPVVGMKEVRVFDLEHEIDMQIEWNDKPYRFD